MIKKLAIVRRQLSLWNESFLKGEDDSKKFKKDKISKKIEDEKEDIIGFKKDKERNIKRRKLEER